MGTPKKVLIVIAASAAASGGGALARSGGAQTMYPHIYGVSNLGETCSGWCYGGPDAGQYLCCGVTKPPK